MKISILFVIICFIWLTICNAQVKDSICIHYFSYDDSHHFPHYTKKTKKPIQTTSCFVWSYGYDNWQQISHIDSIGFSKYKLNSKYFTKYLFNDTLYVHLINNYFCTPQKVLIGEYTNQNSIHIIDYMEDTLPLMRFEGFCNTHIRKKQLSKIERLTFGTNDSIKLLKFDLIISTHDSAYTYTLSQPEIPDSIRNIIKGLKDDSMIILDDIKVLYNNRKRTLQVLYYTIKD
jgi:hypothetical protein